MYLCYLVKNETVTFHTNNALLEYEKHGSTFVIITLENLDGFWYLLHIWNSASIQQRMYETRVHDIDELIDDAACVLAFMPFMLHIMLDTEIID